MLLRASPVACLVVGVLLAAGCSTSGGSGGTGAGGGAGSSGGSGSCKVYDVCSIVTESVVTSATGRDLGAGTENDTNVGSNANLAEVVACSYSNEDGSVSVTVRCCPCGDNDPSAAQAEYQSLGETVTAVSGVGDTAFWVPDTTAGDSYAGTLDVFSGADFYVTVSAVPAFGDFPPGAQTAAAQIAKIVLAAQ